MRLYITMLMLIFSATTFSLSAQDDVKIPEYDMDLKNIVRDYIRAGRTTDKKLVKGKRLRTGEDAPFEKIGLSVGMGSLDFISLSLSTPINEKFKIRGGIGFMPGLVKVNKVMRIEDMSLKVRTGYFPDYDVDLSAKFVNGHILGDFYPIEDVPFHITAGIYLGSNKFKAEGRLKNPETGENAKLMPDPWNTWPKLNVEGYALNIEDGVLNADMVVKSFIKPYLGVGYGYTVPESEWSFNIDLGAVYQGGYKIHQAGKEAPKFNYPVGDPNGHTSSAVDIKKYINRTKFWPVLSIQVSYRIY